LSRDKRLEYSQPIFSFIQASLQTNGLPFYRLRAAMKSKQRMPFRINLTARKKKGNPRLRFGY